MSFFSPETGRPLGCARTVAVLLSAVGALAGLVACGGSTKTVTQTTTVAQTAAQQAPSTNTTASGGAGGAPGGASTTGSSAIAGPPASVDAARLQGRYAMAAGTASGLYNFSTSEEAATTWPMRSTCASSCTVSLNYPLLRSGSGGGFKAVTLHSSGPGRYTSDATSGAADCSSGAGQEQRTISVRVVASETLAGVSTATRVETYESGDDQCPNALQPARHTHFRIHRFGNIAGTL